MDFDFWWRIWILQYFKFRNHAEEYTVKECGYIRQRAWIILFCFFLHNMDFVCKCCGSDDWSVVLCILGAMEDKWAIVAHENKHICIMWEVRRIISCWLCVSDSLFVCTLSPLCLFSCCLLFHCMPHVLSEQNNKAHVFHFVYYEFISNLNLINTVYVWKREGGGGEEYHIWQKSHLATGSACSPIFHDTHWTARRHCKCEYLCL